MGNDQAREAAANKPDAGRAERTPEYLLAPTLLPYLESAWRNSQYYDASRMALYRYYFIISAIGYLMLSFSRTEWLVPEALLGYSCFAAVFGLVAVIVGIRYKERVVRDIRVVYRINELLLNDPEEMKSVKGIFLGYRKQSGPGERRVRARLSTTQLFILMITLFTTGLLTLTVHLTLPVSAGVLIAVAVASLLVHEVVYLLAKRGVAFNI